MLRLIALLVLLAFPTVAQSGAWLREKGALFLSWSNSISTLSTSSFATDTSLYAEYGLTKRLTVGFDGYLGASGKASEAYLFMRMPLGKSGGKSGGKSSRPAQMALTFGMGVKTIPNPWGTTTEQTLAKLGFSWGRGLKKGWLGFDASVSSVVKSSIFVPAQAGTSFSADFTWGQKPSDRLMLIWQVQTGKTTNGPAYAKFAPSLIWSFGGGKNSVEVGLVKGLTGDNTQSVKLGFWKSF
ncbi:hypothetical protein [Profundibacter sp.]